MVSIHGMSKEEVDKMTNKRPQVPRNFWARVAPGQVSAVMERDIAAAAERNA